MSATIPTEYLDLFERPIVAGLATVMPDGQPQVTPVWIDLADGRVRVNTARGRVKDRNLRREGRATVLLIDPDNPYRYLEVRGKVVSEDETHARDHIDSLSMKYLGKPKYPNYPGETRVMYEIEPQQVTGQG